MERTERRMRQRCGWVFLSIDLSPDTIPDTIIDETATSEWWAMVKGTGTFTCAPRDNAGNWGSTSHLGPFYIDLTAPNNPSSVWSSDHTISVWSYRCHDLQWHGAGQAMHSAESTAIPTNGPLRARPSPTRLPIQPSPAPRAPRSPSSSTWYFHIRTRDNAGNFSASAVHTGPYLIDYYLPTNPSSASPNCTAANNTWQNTCSDPNFSWSGASDSMSGVAGYYYYWGTESSGTSVNYTTSAGYNPGAVSNPSTNYLRVQTKDYSGLTCELGNTLHVQI